MGDKGQDLHRPGYQTRNPFGTLESDAFGDQFPEYDGQQRHNDQDQGGGNIGGVGPQYRDLFNIGFEVGDKFLSGIKTHQDGHQSDPDLGGRKK